MRKQKLVSNNIYHVYNRGVEKRHIFLDGSNYSRFIDGLIIFNDIKPIINPKQRIINIKNGSYKRTPLVDILAFCLMTNHFHLLLKQIVDGGITEFMRKLGDGYVKYFNIKHDRVGTLFQGKFKSVLIENDSQFLYIPHYIHLNPLDLLYPNWREKGIKNVTAALNFLDSYRWSSYGDYTEKPNFSLVLKKDILSEYFSGAEEYQKDLKDFIEGFDLEEVSDLILE